MQTRAIGSLHASVIGLGCNNFGGRINEGASVAVVDAALDAGITLFDTADVYGGTLSEEYLGRALGRRRDQAVIATKFGAPIDDERKGGAAPAYIERACEDSLRRLDTDRIDLYQLHFPDQAVPLEDTLAALDTLERAGKVREIGCSNYSAELIEQAESISAEKQIARYVSVQNEYSLLRRGPEQNGVLESCEKYDVAFVPYFPLGSGMLSGKYKRGEAAPEGTRLASMPADRQELLFSTKNFDRIEALEAWARDHGHSLLELAFAWLLSRQSVASVIAGATKPEQVQANAAGAAWELTPAELAEIDAVIEAAKS
jgi:aryl-alcohol dehydrogenase-like predicted oxidoreductase